MPVSPWNKIDCVDISDEYDYGKWVTEGIYVVGEYPLNNTP